MQTGGSADRHGGARSIPVPGSPVAALLRPRAIAVVGASDKATSFGRRLVGSIVEGGYAGAVHPVNPRCEDVGGLACHPSLRSIPGPVDCVAFAVSDRRLEEAMADAAAKGVRGAVVFSRGYEPPDAPRPGMVARWAAVAREAGIAVCGGNGMGFINYLDGLRVTANPPVIPEAARPARPCGEVAVLSHSGSTWSGINGNQRQLAFDFAVSVGREDVTVMADYLTFLLDQGRTRAIGLVLETIRDPQRFVAALERAEGLGVPVVALRLGRTETSQAFVRSHSGALAGSDAAYTALFERYRVSRVRSLDELMDTLELMTCGRIPTTDAIGLGTDSGGERELIADIAADVGVRFATLSGRSRDRLVQVLDPGLEPVNPVDYWGDGRIYWEDCQKILADDPAVGMTVLATNMVSGRRTLYAATEAAENVHAHTRKPVAMMGNLSGTVDRDEAKRVRALGIPVLMGTHNGLAAIGHFLAYHHPPLAPPGAGSLPPPPPAEVIEGWRERLAAAAGATLDAAAALALLADFGCPVATTELAASREEALAAADRIGYPVVVKTAAPGVGHKTDRGGVFLDCPDGDAVGRAYDRLATALGPAAQVQPRVSPGVEVLLGMVHDPQLGPMVTVGLGGVLVEVYRDVVTFMPPVGAGQAGVHLRRLRGFPLLAGARGRPAVDLAALSGAVARFSLLCRVLGPTLSEVDVNPLVVNTHGAVAVDALVLGRDPAASRFL